MPPRLRYCERPIGIDRSLHRHRTGGAAVVSKGSKEGDKHRGEGETRSSQQSTKPAWVLKPSERLSLRDRIPPNPVEKDICQDIVVFR